MLDLGEIRKNPRFLIHQVESNNRSLIGNIRFRKTTGEEILKTKVGVLCLSTKQGNAKYVSSFFASS